MEFFKFSTSNNGNNSGNDNGGTQRPVQEINHDYGQREERSINDNYQPRITSLENPYGSGDDDE